VHFPTCLAVNCGRCVFFKLSSSSLLQPLCAFALVLYCVVQALTQAAMTSSLGVCVWMTLNSTTSLGHTTPSSPST
jgi:hypothetical protein